MKKKLLFVTALFVAVWTIMSCCRKDDTGIWPGKIGPSPEPVSVVLIDLDGDGIPDPANVSGNYNIDPEFGNKYCYKGMQINCDTNGAYYDQEATYAGTSIEQLIEQSTSILDEEGDGQIDYIEEIAQNQGSQIAEEYDTAIVEESTEQINNAILQLPGQTDPIIEDEDGLLLIMNTALEHAISANVDSTSTEIDLEQLELIINSELETAILQAIRLENGGEIPDSAAIYETLIASISQITEEYTQNIVTTIAEEIAEGMLDSYVRAVENETYFQGICEEGWHIPSDQEWMAFERAHGMPLADIARSGVDNNSRGKEEGIARIMLESMGVRYAGYRSENGTYAQLGEATIFYTSTAGTDENGDYVWVRHFDDSFQSVKRYKHYANSAFNVKCFQDR